MYSQVGSKDENRAYLYINDGAVAESGHRTFSETGMVRSTGGREVTREVSQGDKIELRATLMEGYYYGINFCAEYIPKM